MWKCPDTSSMKHSGLRNFNWKWRNTFTSWRERRKGSVDFVDWLTLGIMAIGRDTRHCQIFSWTRAGFCETAQEWGTDMADALPITVRKYVSANTTTKDTRNCTCLGSHKEWILLHLSHLSCAPKYWDPPAKTGKFL